MATKILRHRQPVFVDGTRRRRLYGKVATALDCLREYYPDDEAKVQEMMRRPTRGPVAWVSQTPLVLTAHEAMRRRDQAERDASVELTDGEEVTIEYGDGTREAMRVHVNGDYADMAELVPAGEG